ncbi:MAG: LPS export ABC transporter periplasmic protein LptC [Nitrospiraceae bacterium]|nr:LPS export ABC transporter periplasmic protein LptC [Nitrospiraceae bacterium]
MNKALFPAVALALIFLFFLIVRDEKEVLPSASGNGESFLEGVRIIQKKDGKEIWVVTARRADITGNGDRANLSDIEVKVREKGATITADKGLYDMKEKKLTITGPVTARDKDYTITARDVEFDNATGALKTDKDVRMEGKKFVLTGTGLLADNNEQKIRILKNVTATYNTYNN